MKYLNCAIALDGGTICLSLEDDRGHLYDIKLDKKIGTSTLNRIFVNETLVDINKEEKWVQVLRETISESTFKYEGEQKMIEHIISTLAIRN